VKPFVGGFEDSLLSLFSYATSICPLKKCVLLLDGVDELFVENVKNTTDTSREHSRRYHLSFRTRNLFFDILDKLTRCDNHQECCSLSNLLVICTSKAAGENVRDRFHKVFHLGNPDETERKMILESCLQKPIGEMPEDVVNMLEELVADTVGKSRGDIAQHCRDAFDVIPGINNDSIEVFSSRLDVVKNSITTIMPASIKNITGEGFVDMKVSSARELTREFFNGSGNLVFPLFGDNAKYCWAQLENLIVSPLCRKKTLDRLLYGDCYHSSGSGERNPGNAGVLVTGPPGTGKSVIARYCAAYAASLDANIRLVEVPCTSLIHKELGSSEICVHKLFEAVRAAAPCILVLDGIENIAPVRGHDNTSEGTMDRLLSTLLIEMDGVSRVGKSNNDSGIAVIGITHNPVSWIDPAMLRPGRLEKCIYMEKPCIITRKKIFSDAIKELTIDFSGTGLFDPKDEEQLADAVAIMTHNKSAADVIALCNNAKIQALKRYLDDIDGAWKLKSSELSVSYYHFLGRSSK
jgi:SpoVK/Ycf46/Vps4 family AAA+-type ATPase